MDKLSYETATNCFQLLILISIMNFFLGQPIYPCKVLKNVQTNFHNFSEEWTRSRKGWRSSLTRLQLQKQESHTLKTSRQTFFFLAHFEDIKANFFVAKISRRFLHTLIICPSRFKVDKIIFSTTKI